MARVRVVLNNRGMRELLTRDETSQMLHRKASRVLQAAKAAPDVTYEYEQSLHVVDDVTLGPKGRARSRVIADVPYALARESKDRTLGRSLDAADG